MTELTLAERLDQAELALNEGRIIQHSWRRKGDDGRELVCALAAFGHDINSAEDCPADLMPQWMAQLIPVLDDQIAEADVPWFMRELVARARRWRTLDNVAWDRIRTGFMVGLVRQAVDAATPVQPDPQAAHWQQVLAAADRVTAALESGDPEELAAAEAAAWAARAAAEAAAEAAWAAREAAEAARAAAEAAAEAAWAARAAAWAAAWAAAEAAAEAAAWAARAAREAAGRKMCEFLFRLIDAELADTVG